MHERLEDWFDTIKPTAYQQLQSKQLKMWDAQCLSCMKQKEMLCDGIRPVYQKEASEQYGVPKVSHGACTKLIAKQQSSTLDKRLAASCLPKKIIQQFIANPVWECPKVQVTDAGLSVDSITWPTMMYDLYSDGLHSIVSEITVAAIMAGYTARCVLVPIVLDKYAQWNKFLSDFGDGVELLALERYDMGTAPAYIIDYLIQTIRYRRDNGLTTIVTVGATPKARNDQELELYEEMQQWNSLREELKCQTTMK